MVHECSLCDQGIEHCHGTLVQHVDTTVECTDPSCDDVVVETHELVLECWRVAGGCACVVDVGVVDVGAAEVRVTA
jgi:hypothetical protein